MADREKLLELAERCERAEGPDRNLDAMIHHAVKTGVGTGYAADAPSYTASVDAAMRLVPEAVNGSLAYPQIGRIAPDKWQANIGFCNRAHGVLTTAATPALALTAASLRALATKETDHGRPL